MAINRPPSEQPNSALSRFNKWLEKFKNNLPPKSDSPPSNHSPIKHVTGQIVDDSPFNTDTRLAPSSERISQAQEVIVPAGKGRQPVIFLANPAYIRVDHGGLSIKVSDNGSSAIDKPPAYYAIYVFSTPNGTKRFVTLPVSLNYNPEKKAYHQSLIEEIAAQGFDQDDIKKNCDEPNVSLRIDWHDRRILGSFRYALFCNNLLPQSPHPENVNNILQSGIRPDGKLDILCGPINKPKYYIPPQPRAIAHIDLAPWTKFGNIQSISEPLDLSNPSGFDAQLYRKILDANQ